jgi:serine/threonine-protein kinase
MLERPIGSVFAGYRIDRVIGRGGMGVVYLATQVALDRLVALKIVAPELGTEATFRERFARELKFVASVDHPNVIPVYDARSEDGVLFIAMRYVEGTDLRELLLAEGRLEPARAVGTVDQVAQALDAVHEIGVVHRDVKPANVLIGRRRGADHVYLTDFGLSKHTTSGLGMTAPGQWVGTVDYVPPEQILGQTLDQRTDVYALGCMLYEVLTGRVPYAKEGDAAKLWAHMHDDPPKLADAGVSLPEGLDDVLARAIAKRPEDRWSSAGELAQAAREALEQASPTVIGGVFDDDDEDTTRISPLPGPATSAPSAGNGQTGGGTGTREPSGADFPTEVREPSDHATRPPSEPDWRRPSEVREPADTGDATRITGPSQADRPPPSEPDWRRPSEVRGPAETGDATRVTGPSELHEAPPPARRAGAATGGAAATGAAATGGAAQAPGAPGPPPAAPPAAEGEAKPWWRRTPVVLGIVAVVIVAAAVPLLLSGGGGSGGGDLSTSTVGVGRAPAQVAADGDAVWVVNSGDDTITKIDNAGKAGSPVAAGRSPEAVAVGEGGIWVTNAFGALTRIDPATGRADPEPIELNTDPYAVAAGAGSVWVANGLANSVTVIDPEGSDTVGSPIRVGLSPYALAVGEGTVWVANHDSGTVSKIDAETRKRTGSEIEVGRGPTAIAVGGGNAWVANSESNNVSRIDTKTGKVVGRPVAVGRAPSAVAIGGGSVWVANSDSNTVTRIDPGTGKVDGDPIPVGKGPQGIAFAGGSVWVANSGSNDVTRIEL